jgi:hypothetical protein
MSQDEGFEPLEKQTISDNLAEQQRLTVQTRATQPADMYGMPAIMMLADTGSLVPAWWTPMRDRYLSREWQKCPLFAGAAYNVAAKLATIPPIIEPRDPSVKAQRDLAEEYARLLYEGSEFGRGWIEFAMKWHVDRWTTDNGAFAEVLGEGRKDGPIRGPAAGLANLDSSLCTRTGNPIYPVVYEQESTGKKFKLHYTRVIFGSQMPSTRDEMNGIGLGWFSRVISFAQSVVDDLTYKQEKLGRRPKRAILIGKKVDVSQIQAAFKMADEAADNAGLSRVSVMPVIANPNAADVDIGIVDLASLRDGFDWQTDVNLAMYAIGLTGGFPVRWMWPATVVGATKADAMIQHMVGAMSGTAHELGTLALLLAGSERGMFHQAGKYLPPGLRLRFDVQDDWIDEIQAGIQNTRAQKYKSNLEDGAVTVRVTREQMLQTGEITEAQFREMELADGRTQDGLPVDTLFYTGNPYLSSLDPETYNETAVKTALQEAKRASVQETDQGRRSQAREAVAALDWLVEQNEEPEEPEGAEPAQPEGQRQPESPQDETPAAEDDEEAAEPEEVKALKGARARFETDFADDVGAELGSEEAEALDDLEAGEQPDTDTWQRRLGAILLVWLTQAFLDRLGAVSDEMGVPLDPAEAGVLAATWAAGAATAESARLMLTTRKVIGRVQAAQSQGPLSREQIAALVKPAFARYRADSIAATETTGAYSAATIEFRNWLKEHHGVDLEGRWLTAEDERVCVHICLPLDGQPERVWSQQFPGGPPAHNRCRCTIELKAT